MMRFSIAREQFIKPIIAACSVIEKRGVMPILQNIQISISPDKPNEIMIIGTDLETQITSRVILEDPSSIPGSTTVNAKKFSDIVKSLPDQSVINFGITEAEKAKVTAHRSRFSLSLIPSEDYPTFASETRLFDVTLTQGELKKAIDATSFAMGHNDVRHYINGLFLEFNKEGAITLVATDGHRMTLTKVHTTSPVVSDGSIILPRKSVIELAKLLTPTDDPVIVTLGEGFVEFAIGDLVFTSKLVSGKFPEYQRVIPKNNHINITANRSDLKTVVQRAVILANERYKGVTITATSDALKVNGNNPENEEAEEIMDAHCDSSGEHTICFNASYMLDVLSATDADEVRISIKDESSSMLIQSDKYPDQLFIIMPMRQ